MDKTSCFSILSREMKPVPLHRSCLSTPPPQLLAKSVFLSSSPLKCPFSCGSWCHDDVLRLLWQMMSDNDDDDDVPSLAYDEDDDILPSPAVAEADCWGSGACFRFQRSWLFLLLQRASWFLCRRGRFPGREEGDVWFLRGRGRRLLCGGGERVGERLRLDVWWKREFFSFRTLEQKRSARWGYILVRIFVNFLQ